MKKIIMLLAMVASTLAFGAKELNVGTSADFKPYEYMENGQFAGFDVELMNAIGKKIGYDIKWNDMSFDGLIPALQTGKLDVVIAGMVPTEERKKHADFSEPYMSSTQSVHYVIVNEKDTMTKKEELKGKKAGVQMGTVQEGFAKDLGAIPQLYSNWTGAFMDLQQQKISAVIVADATGQGYLDTMKGLKKLDDDIIDTRPGASIAFKKGNSELVAAVNKALNELIEEGTYLELLERFFPDRAKEFKEKYNK